ncbi:MAG: S41 family peptidase [Acidobacteria bacterium]|nr:S41 family peptidase [Acidobacteriota bacterium]
MFRVSHYTPTCSTILAAMRTYRSVSLAAFAVVVSALVGGFFGGRVLATQNGLPERYAVFTSALDLIDAKYVEKVESDRVVYGAISGMLSTLDPHSSFMDPKAYAQLRERQEGHYYGLGISINVVGGDITVMSLFEGSPAYQKGIRRGDIVARINGDDAKGWTSDQAVSKLRGPRGTPVQVSIKRTGYEQLIEVEVVRDEIVIPSVPSSFMISGDTGYIQLRDFSETTDRELGAALKDLTGKGMKRLLLDIRENPGGPLDQAIKVSNRFLKRGDLIVYTRGRIPNSDQDYRAVENSDYTNLPMVVLTNRRSASAAEIVSGALQDHDRALVVGETTWGKALVQSIYRVSEGAGLALTTAHYFTPAGRLIQRPWDETFDEYLSYTTRDQDPNKTHPVSDLKYTMRLGRKVYSGGGIEPDHRMDGPVEGFNPGKFARRLYPGTFATFAQRFDREGDTRFGTATDAKARRTLTREFTVDDAMVQEFKTFVRAQLRDQSLFDEAGFNTDIEFIRGMIRYEVDVALFDVTTARRHLLERDPQARYALTLFTEAEVLLKATPGAGSQVSR